MADTFPTEDAQPASVEKQQTYTRFSGFQRAEHAILLTSFTILGITGLAQKFSANIFADALIGVLGGIESTRLIHRTAAIVLMAVSIFHIVAVLYRVFVLRYSLSMLPTFQDFVHLFQDVMYYAGRSARKAYYGRYSYAEKAEYLAVVWGTVIMAITGFMMWNPIATTQFLPGEYIPAAKAAHGGEALLAVLAIILWHFYHVHLRHFNKSMFTGKLTREEMEHEHPAELAMIEAGQAGMLPPPRQIRQREKIFFPVAAVLVLGLTYGLFRFATFETTAIAGIPEGETAPIFVTVPPTPTDTPLPTATPLPTPTPLPPGESVQAASWEGDIFPLLNNRCGACHIQSDSGGLSLATYDSALEGGNKGPAIVPGDPQTSVLMQIQMAGGHPGQLSEQEVELLASWIQAGAPQQASEAAAATPPPTQPAAGAQALSWNTTIQPLVENRCAACHIQATMGGLSLKGYADALQGGSQGPAVVPGDSQASMMVQVQSAGGHPGQFTEPELQMVIDWIDSGAPEEPASAGGATGTPAAAPTSGATPAATGSPAAGTPEAGSPAAGVLSWNTGVQQLLGERCNACHIQTSFGELSFRTYQDALKGGNSGPAVVPGQPNQSTLVLVQAAGEHPGQLTEKELADIVAWIQAGAPENPPPGAAAAAPTAASATQAPAEGAGASWEAAIFPVIQAKCSACHVQASMGGLSLATYVDALKGGDKGPAVLPGDSEGSVLIQVQSAGGHPGQLSEEELAAFTAWIEAGAPEK